MKILLSGSSGFIGSRLVADLSRANHAVSCLVRHRPGPDQIFWNPPSYQLNASHIEGFDAVIHLAGENIATQRWTAEKKKRIRESRVEGTHFLCETLQKLSKPPQVLISASAIGFYGDRGSEILKEESSVGRGFLSEVCQAWEQAADPARKKGIRVVHLRFAVVLDIHGGALVKMLLPFRLGLGGKVGRGDQYMSWISLKDLAAVVLYVLNHDSLKGPVNVVSPLAVTHLEFTKTLGKVLHRPTVFPMPAFLARLIFGELADALLLASTRVIPEKLLANGFQFQYPQLEMALKDLLQS
ncbi:MAG: TIGR01777 family protein [Chlamydiae bacterium]|nr:TIGR01777 family protein [Chlamydiota bacterium]MBI3265733.1 TIGR01777 family protein [Chlamydiota bacterium]